MTARARLAALVLALVAVLAATAASARAQDAPPSADELHRRVAWLRELPPAERENLRAALRRFRDLPAAERDALRRRAATLGPERLDALAGRDLRTVAKLRGKLAAEADAVLAAVPQERLASLTTDERAYLRAEAMRRFQLHLRRKLLQLRSVEDWERTPPEERRAQLRDAFRRKVDERVAQLPDEERARLRRLPPDAQAGEVARLAAEVRMDETREFGRIFERWVAQPFLAKDAAARAETVRRWRERSRWFALVRVLREDVGLTKDVRRELAVLGPADWGRILLEVENLKDAPIEDRRLKVESLIGRLAGERTLDPQARERRLPGLVRTLRERRLVHGAGPREGSR